MRAITHIFKEISKITNYTICTIPSELWILKSTNSLHPSRNYHKNELHPQNIIVSSHLKFIINIHINIMVNGD